MAKSEEKQKKQIKFEEEQRKKNIDRMVSGSHPLSASSHFCYILTHSAACSVSLPHTLLSLALSLFLLLSEFSFSFLMFYYHLSRFTLWWIFLLSVFPTPLLLRHLFIGKRPFPPTTLFWGNYSVINEILYKNNFNALRTFFEI